MGDWVRLNSDKMMVRVEQIHDAYLQCVYGGPEIVSHSELTPMMNHDDDQDNRFPSSRSGEVGHGRLH